MKTKLTPEEKEARKVARIEANKATKEAARIEAEKNQKPVKSITISIEWKKSRTWGANPHAEAAVYFHDGTTERRDGYTCSGCGYDKESTVIAEIFNEFMKYKLWNLSAEAIKGGQGSMDSGPAPYGINNYSPSSRSFGGGIGTSCYYRIAEYLGGKFENVASGKTFDVYKYTE
jgi:hypothetical protein